MYHIYRMSTEPLADSGTFAEYYRQMPAERQKKIDRIRPEQEKMLSLAAGILLERGLEEYGLCSSKVRISIGRQGKPFLPDFPDIHFSLSHSKEMAMAVFSDTEVGCDIEYQKGLNEKLASRFFCPGEYAWMKEAENEDGQRDRFYRLWTLKESFVKATGEGLRLPLRSFCFAVAPGTPCEERTEAREDAIRTANAPGFFRRASDVRITQHYDQEQYEFEEYHPETAGEYCAAVCLRRKNDFQ